MRSPWVVIKVLKLKGLGFILNPKPWVATGCSGRLAKEFDWICLGGTVLVFWQELQKKRKANSNLFYKCKKQLIQLHLKAAKCVEEQISPLQETLVPLSYKA